MKQLSFKEVLAKEVGLLESTMYEIGMIGEISEPVRTEITRGEALKRMELQEKQFMRLHKFRLVPLHISIPELYGCKKK